MFLIIIITFICHVNSFQLYLSSSISNNISNLFKINNTFLLLSNLKDQTLVLNPYTNEGVFNQNELINSIDDTTRFLIINNDINYYVSLDFGVVIIHDINNSSVLLNRTYFSFNNELKKFVQFSDDLLIFSCKYNDTIKLIYYILIILNLN